MPVRARTSEPGCSRASTFRGSNSCWPRSRASNEVRRPLLAESMKGNHRLDIATAEIARRYLAGETPTRIASDLRCADRTVRLRLAKAGVPMRPGRPVNTHSKRRKLALQYTSEIRQRTPCAECGGPMADWHNVEHLQFPERRVCALTSRGRPIDVIAAEIAVCTPLCRRCHMLVDGRREAHRPNSKKTQCKYGHPFDTANTRFSARKGGSVRRECRACHRDRVRRAKRAKRARGAA